MRPDRPAWEVYERKFGETQITCFDGMEEGDGMDSALTSIEKLEGQVIDWASDRDIFAQSSPIAQWSKTNEELYELLTALRLRRKPDIEDAIGDILVTLIIQAEMHETDLRTCLAAAWMEIKDRKGRMVDGVFVKDGE